MSQPPKILNISTIAQSQLFTIQAVDLQFSNGTHRTYERLKPFSRAAVMVLPIDGEDLLMVREYAMGTERYELGFCKGGMDIGETPEQSANRELQEEIGIKANQLIYLRCVNTNPAIMQNPMHIFIAKDFTPSKLTGDEPEPLEIVRYPLAKLDELIANPDFTEARNLVALYALRGYLRKDI